MRELELDELDLVHGGYQPGTDGPSGGFGMGQMGRRTRSGGSSGSAKVAIPGFNPLPAWHPEPATLTVAPSRFSAFLSISGGSGSAGVSLNFGSAASVTYHWDSSCGECH